MIDVSQFSRAPHMIVVKEECNSIKTFTSTIS